MELEIYWQGKDITGLVQVRKCVGHDTCGKRCDSLEMEFENAAGWMRWGPEEDDQILVSRDGYDTGILFLNTILPEDGRYRVLATALPCAARQREWRSFAFKTLEEVMRSCGMATGMGYALYGCEGEASIPYIQQENESAAAFLARLLSWEGAKLKCVGAKYKAIGLAYAQARPAHQALQIRADQRGVEYLRGGLKWRSVRVLTPWADVTATDEAAPENHPKITLNLPACSPAQAGRWARGALLDHNRQDEILILSTDFNPGFSALARIDINGGTDADGQWLVEEAEQDFKNGTSMARLLRCVDSIQ